MMALVLKSNMNPTLHGLFDNEKEELLTQKLLMTNLDGTSQASLGMLYPRFPPPH